MSNIKKTVVVSLAAVFGACGAESSDEPRGSAAQALEPETGSLTTPNTSPAEQGPPPAVVEDITVTHTMLLRSAAVVEAVARDLRYDYDESHGPRTIVSFDVSDVYLGAFGQRVVEVAQFGGPTPDGRFVSTSISTDFVRGGRYVLFLKNTRWFYSPLAAPALRVAHVEGREVLVNDTGGALTRLNPEGMQFRPEPLFATKSASGVLQEEPKAVTERQPYALDGALDRRAFRELLGEAVSVEAVAPSGSAVLVAEARGPDWRVAKTTPVGSARAVADPEGGAVSPDTGAVR